MFQLREYARWFSQVRALRRFRQASDDWDVPTEDDSPDPDPAAREDDVRKAGGGIETVVTYATVRVMRNGSIMARNGHGAAVVLAAEDAYLSAPRNLYIEAGCDIVASAGRDFLVKVRRSVDVVAVRGGISFYAKAWFKAFSELGSAWIRSGAEDPTKEDYEAPEVEEGDPTPEVLEHAVFLEATAGRTKLRSARQMRLETVGPQDEDTDTDDSANIVIDSKGTTALRGGKNLTLSATRGFVALRSAKDMLISCAKTMFFQAAVVDFFKMLAFTKGSWQFIAPVKAISVSAGQILNRKTGHRTPPGSPGVPSHSNHVGVIPDDFEVVPVSEEEREGLTAIQETAALPARTEQTSPLWGFQTQDSYSLGEAVRYESHSQQALAEADLDHYGEWNWAADEAGGPGIDAARKRPWGASYTFRRHRGGTKFSEFSASVPGNAATSWSSGSAVFLYYRQHP
jgi:hypothetical protein